ncbi:MAG: zinc-binding dehydrogenase, partial [Pseudomonadota bacterium]
LLALAAGGLPYRLVGKSIGVLAVPTGPEALSAAAILATEGALSPQVETVGLDDAPEALRRVGAGEVRGKLVIRP